MKNIVIIGAGGFGREVAWLIEDINKVNKQWNLLGFIDENIKNHGKVVNGYKVLGGFEFLENKNDIYYVCAIGKSSIRKRVVEDKCDNLKIKAATLIHPSVIMSNNFNTIGEGSIVCAANVLTVNISIGKHSIINLDCTIGHDVKMGNFSTIYPSSNISGECIIGECTEVGTGTQVIQGKKIGDNCILGAGSVVINDINENCVVVGIPAKVIKVNEV